MCGFIASINFKNGSNNSIFHDLKRINSHRGPDQISFLKKENYSIIFRRLKIIDLSNKANQPFIDKRRGLKIIFNGEIYNYLEIKQELKKLNIRFETKSDTEVILKSYIKWGMDFIHKLRGMFSIVIFDDQNKKVLFFRDRLGQKPLFYSFQKNNLILSSEIKDIIFFKKEISPNYQSIEKYLVRGWCDDNEKTFFKDIKSLKPGHVGIYSKNSFEIKRYWKLKYNSSNKYNREEFKELFKDNIKLHLRSDVPIAFTLSGGVDSTSIVKSSLDYGLKKYNTYSISSEFHNIGDEKKDINKFVALNKINHKFVQIDFKNHENILENFLKSQDEPVNHVSFLYQYIIRKEIKSDGYKVLINGEGGDEIFGGYIRMFLPYLIENFILKKKEIPNEFKKNFEKVSGYSFQKFHRNIIKFIKNKNFFSDIEDKSYFSFSKSNYLKNSLRFKNSVNISKKNLFKKYLFSHLFSRDLPHILRQEDRTSMSQSIENRAPFVDHKIIEYIFSLNPEVFMQNGISKFILKDIMSNQIKDYQLNKIKVGRPGHSKNLITKLYKKKFLDLINSSNIVETFIDKKKFTKYLKSENFKDFNNLPFRVLNCLIWEQNLKNYF